MNYKNFAIGTVAVIIFTMIFDYVFHGMVMKDMYAATMNLWRPEADMEKLRGWMIAGQLLFAVMFCWIFAQGCECKGIGEGVRYGFYIALLMSSSNLIFYAVQPFPLNLVLSWIGGNIVEGVGAGVILAALYKK